MKSLRYILTAVLLLAAASAAAQDQHDAYRYGAASANQAVYTRPYWAIDWLPNPGTELYDDIASRQIRRYSLAVHPFFLLKDGLKLDFEMELPRSGTWLQFGLMGYHANEVDDWEADFAGWGELAPTYDDFNRMVGAGVSIAYKSMISHGGFYVSAGLLYNYYSVDYNASRYFPFGEDGLSFYEQRWVEQSTRFHQPALSLNLGRHMAFGRAGFMDLFVGIGYRYILYDGPKIDPQYHLDYHSKTYFNAGLRLGVLWQ